MTAPDPTLLAAAIEHMEAEIALFPEAEFPVEHEWTRAVVAAAKAYRPWQPIETAPKDGTWVLLFSPDTNGPAFVGQWLDDPQDPDGGAWWEFGDQAWPVDAAATHWQPLPAPPAALNPAGPA